MRVVLASSDVEWREWVAHVLASSGYTVVIVPDLGPTSPELRGAELLIGDGEALRAVGEAGPKRRLLLTPRGAVVDMGLVRGGQVADVLALPGSADEVLARVRHALGS